MNILVTGAQGMAGSALVRALENLRAGKDRTRPALAVGEIFALGRGADDTAWDAACARADFVFHFAGVNRAARPEDFDAGNAGLTAALLERLERAGNTAPVMLASSVQATLAGRFGDSAYGRSKLAAESLVFSHAARTGAMAAVYRFPNLLGPSRPHYNSAAATFCWAAAHGEEIPVNDPATELELLWIGDMVDGMLDLLEGRTVRCEFDGVNAVPRADGRFCYVPGAYHATLGELAALLTQFRAQPETLKMPRMPEGSLAKRLFSLYLTYLPKEKMRYALCAHADARGSFTELLRSADCGQVSVNVARPGVTKGQHWHCAKWEQFIVVHGHGLIRERNLATGETVEFEVRGEQPESVYMIPGWTHSITNLSDTEDLVTVMTCNECFDPAKPDTFAEEV